MTLQKSFQRDSFKTSYRKARTMLTRRRGRRRTLPGDIDKRNVDLSAKSFFVTLPIRQTVSGQCTFNLLLFEQKYHCFLSYLLCLSIAEFSNPSRRHSPI